jgi:hypothetical protein
MPNIYDVIEQDITLTGTFTDPFNDVAISVTITRPDGTTFTIGGFFHSVVGGNSLFKFRHMAKAVGTYSEAATKTIAGATTTAGNTSHVVTAGGTLKGHVKIHPTDARALVYDNGAPANLIGITNFSSQNGANTDATQPGDQNDGTTNTGNYYLTTKYFNLYGNAFNLYRWSAENNTFQLTSSVSASSVVFHEANGRILDVILQKAFAKGMTINFCLMEGRDGFAVYTSTGTRASQTKYINYCVDRYGAYVGFWEMLNETRTAIASEFIEFCLNTVEARDPYLHPMTTSFQYGGSGNENTSLRNLTKHKITAPHAYWDSTGATADTEILTTIENTADNFGKYITINELGRHTNNYIAGVSDLAARAACICAAFVRL